MTRGDSSDPGDLGTWPAYCSAEVRGHRRRALQGTTRVALVSLTFKLEVPGGVTPGGYHLMPAGENLSRDVPPDFKKVGRTYHPARACWDRTQTESAPFEQALVDTDNFSDCGLRVGCCQMAIAAY